MRSTLLVVLLAALLAAPAGATSYPWRIARVWDDGAAKSQALSPAASARSRASISPPGVLNLSVGCNSMTAPGLKSDGTALLEDPAMTMMGCPPDLQALEDRVIAALKLVRSHERTGNEMILRDGEGKEVLALIR